MALEVCGTCGAPNPENSLCPVCGSPTVLPTGRADSADEVIGYIVSAGPEHRAASSAIWAPLLCLTVVIAATATSVIVPGFGILPVVTIGVLMVAALQRLTGGLAGRALPLVRQTAEAVQMLSPRPTPVERVSLPFRVTTTDGLEVSGVLSGIQSGTSFAVGDHVVAKGRPLRWGGKLRAASVRDLRTAAVVRAHRTTRFGWNRVSTWLLPIAVTWAAYALYQLAS